MRRLVLIVCLAACSGGSGGTIDFGSLSGELVKSYCEMYVRCGMFKDTATCLDLNLDVMLDADLVAAVNAGKVTYHGDKARECLDALSSEACTRGVILSNRAAPEACDETFTGTVAAGGACGLDQECVSQDCTKPASCNMACCQGTCTGSTAPTRPKLGESCVNTTNCLDSYCDTTTSVCTAYKQNGTPCTSSSECADGMTCSGTPMACTPLAAPGQACMSTTDCRDINDDCNATSKTCVAGGLPGAPCMSASDCVTGPYLCDATGHCALRPRLGESCATASCIDNSYCDATTKICTAPKADGAACDPTQTSHQCQSGSCDSTSKQCVTPPTCI